MDGLAVERENGILQVTLDRPEAGNLLTAAMVEGLMALLREVCDDPGVRVLVLRGAGEHFSDGLDPQLLLPVLHAAAPERAALAREAAARLFAPLSLALHRMPQPVLVSARGHVLGAAVQLAAVADLVIASETARFAAPQIKQAHTLAHGESWFLPRKVGLARAMHICLLGERFDAVQAERYGLVNWVVADSDLEKHTAVVAAQLAASPPGALRAMKALLSRSPGCAVEDQLALEAETLGLCAAQEDFLEAVRAQLSRSEPEYECGAREA